MVIDGKYCLNAVYIKVFHIAQVLLLRKVLSNLQMCYTVTMSSCKNFEGKKGTNPIYNLPWCTR